MKSHSALHALWLTVLLFPPAAAAQSNTIPCDATGAAMRRLPEIDSKDTGALTGTLYTVSEQVRMTQATAGPGSPPKCYPQWVRAYRRDAPASWNPASSLIANPTPGPTLRARLGDLVKLTFLNSIDANKFPNADTGCDRSGTSTSTAGEVYPGQTGDVYPDCFAGSVFTNIHYHGTHTNPNTTGDNVFLNIRPSPRNNDATRAPIITATSVEPQFDDFFKQCDAQLKLDPGPKIWPRLWRDLPPALQTTLMDDVQKYGVKGWYEANLNLIADGKWPQYFVGAYPYCFKLPQYVAATPSPTSPEVQTPHTHGAGAAEVDEAKAPARPLLMGQSPGTHWYHAHKHGSTTINVMNGMTGAFIIEGAYDAEIRKYYADRKTPLQDPWVLVIQQLGSTPGLAIGTPGGPGPDFSVNGLLRPTIAMKGNEVQMWRLVNTSARAAAYFLEPAAKTLQWKQLAQDGVQFKPSNYAQNSNDEFMLAPGNRADLLVKAPPFNPASGANNTYSVLVYNTVDASDRPPAKPAVQPFTLMTVTVTANGSNMDFIPEAQAPAFLPFLADITDDEVTGWQKITFSSTPVGAGPPPASQHEINGKKFDGEVGVVVGLNQTQEWQIVNETFGPATNNQISHPFHIHINPFQVTEVFDPNATLSVTPGIGLVTAPGNTTAGATTSVITISGGTFGSVRPGDFIFIDNSNTPTQGALPPATVLSIAADGLSLTYNIVTPANKTATNAKFSIGVPLYTVDKATALPKQCVIDPNDDRTWKPCTPTEPAHDRIWWDVFSIPSGNTFTTATGSTVNIPGHFRMRSRFVDYYGYYVIHCHILAHEDRGMMTVVNVSPLQSPYSHH